MSKAEKFLSLLKEDHYDDGEFDSEEERPSEDDIIIHDSGTLGSRTSVSAGGKHIGEFKSNEEAEKAIVTWINQNKFYPGIWYQDDHGGVSPYTLEPKNQKKIKI